MIVDIVIQKIERLSRGGTIFKRKLDLRMEESFVQVIAHIGGQ